MANVETLETEGVLKAQEFTEQPHMFSLKALQILLTH